MKMFAIVAAPLALLVAAAPSALAKGRNELINFPIAEVMSNPEFKDRLPKGVRFYFGTQRAAVSKRLGPTHTSKKTSSFKKSDKTACEWAMLSALIAIGEDARARGGNAVINIKSNYENNETSSNATYVCGAGKIMAGVALKGEVAVVR
ncbi:MAG TPA: hypothetical protein VEA44_15910 [Caulobacter sp.]|nr:hypothetical protein [Caulobacter sp.]